MLPVLMISQDITVGLLSYDISRTYQGYTLIYPHNQSSVFLLNNCGEVVNEWDDEDDFRPGNTAYLLADGTLARAKRPASITNDAIWAGGGGAIIELLTWDNELIWSYELNNENARLHHDFKVMPSGNILMLAWERITNAEAISAGRDSTKLNQIDLWPDYIFEVDPSNDSIVWEWHVWDHLIQDFDSTKNNFGVVSDFPELINLNWDTSNGAADWMHSNALDYNEELDHIMLSVPTFNEIWIIDHSTTTSQAASSVGGRSNHGGNLLYRVGNPATYNRADAGEQILYYQHDAHWVNEFIPDAHPQFGNIVCFNNRQPGGYSSIEIFPSEWNMYTVDYDKFQGSWPPYQFDNTITHPDTFALNSSGLSSAQLLPNGNLLACSGRFGYLVELTPDNEVVWEYITPRMGTQEVEQGTMLEMNDNLTFRAFKYPIDYSAFDDKDLTPKGFIELNPVEDWCQRLVSTNTPIINQTLLNGILHKKVKGNGGMIYVDISDLKSNIYFIKASNGFTLRLIKM